MTELSHGKTYDCKSCDQPRDIASISRTLLAFVEPLYFVDSNQIPVIVYGDHDSTKSTFIINLLRCSDPLCTSNTVTKFWEYSDQQVNWRMDG